MPYTFFFSIDTIHTTFIYTLTTWANFLLYRCEAVAKNKTKRGFSLTVNIYLPKQYVNNSVSRKFNLLPKNITGYVVYANTTKGDRRFGGVLLLSLLMIIHSFFKSIFIGEILYMPLLKFKIYSQLVFSICKLETEH